MSCSPLLWVMLGEPIGDYSTLSGERSTGDGRISVEHVRLNQESCLLGRSFLYHNDLLVRVLDNYAIRKAADGYRKT
jgi:hypothetical protein